MDISESVALCEVTGSIVRAVLDSRDAGDRPDARELPDLKATLTARIPYLIAGGQLIVLDPIVLVTNQAGEIINPASLDEPPQVIATDQPGQSEFRYAVQITWRGQTPEQAAALSWDAAAPAGGVLDLSHPVDPPAPEEVPEWERVLAEVEAVRQAVQALLEDTEQARDGAVVEREAAEAARDAAEQYRDEAGEIVAGEIIDDAAPSAVRVYSSERVTALLAALDAAKAPVEHTHSAGQITSGIMQSARLPSSTTAGRGIVELATNDEAVTGTDTSRATTPAGVAAALSAFGDRLPEPPGALDARLAAPLAGGRSVVVFAGSSTTWMDVWPAVLARQVAGRWRQPARVKLTDSIPTGDQLVFVNAGVNGTNAGTYITDTTRPQINALNPSAIFHMVGSNDWKLGRTPAWYRTNLTSQIAGLSSSRPLLHVLVHQHERADTDTGSWDDYGQVLREIAADRSDTIVVDVADAMRAAGVGRGLGNAYGLLGADDIHLTDLGGEVLGDLIADRLGLASGGASSTDTGWIDISNRLISGFSAGTIQARRDGDWVMIRGISVTGSFAASSTTDFISGLDSIFRPSLQAWGTAWGGTGTDKTGSATARTNGTVGVTFGTAMSSMQFTIVHRI